MLKLWLLTLTLTAATASSAQFQQPTGEQISGLDAIHRALKASSLTTDSKPFHAILQIGTTGTPYSGNLELWWLTPTQYHLVLTSPSFIQIRTVNGTQTQEEDHGEYYPRWLEDFSLALLNPLPMAANFQGGEVTIGPQIARACLRRDDRPNGITDELTWGQICFAGAEPRISSVLTFNHSMTYSDWKSFGKKQIPRTYQTDVLDYKPITANLTTLEDLKHPDLSLFTIAGPTQPLATTFVSTLKEESLLDHAPQIVWPAVREGKTEGYMILYARTDRTGQVRETAKHNSDQPGLESFGMQQALAYKFKPLFRDGVPQQMEMPLVLHFSTTLADPIPILSIAEMKKQVISCEARLAPGVPHGTIIQLIVSVDETGKESGVNPQAIAPGAGPYIFPAMESMRRCRFKPYLQNGKPTYYKGLVELTP